MFFQKVIFLIAIMFLWMHDFRNVPLQACMHRVPVDKSKRVSRWPLQWPLRLEKPPYWLNSEARTSPIQNDAVLKVIKRQLFDNNTKCQ